MASTGKTHIRAQAAKIRSLEPQKRVEDAQGRVRLRDLTTLRSQRKQVATSPDLRSPSYEATAAKLQTVASAWSQMKAELRPRDFISKSANVSFNESSSVSASKLQGLKLVQVIKSSSSPPPNRPNPGEKHENPLGKSRNILFKRKAGSPIRAEQSTSQADLITKALLFATEVVCRVPDSRPTPPEKKYRKTKQILEVNLFPSKETRNAVGIDNIETKLVGKRTKPKLIEINMV